MTGMVNDLGKSPRVVFGLVPQKRRRTRQGRNTPQSKKEEVMITAGELLTELHAVREMTHVGRRIMDKDLTARYAFTRELNKQEWTHWLSLTARARMRAFQAERPSIAKAFPDAKNQINLALLRAIRWTAQAPGTEHGGPNDRPDARHGWEAAPVLA